MQPFAARGQPFAGWVQPSVGPLRMLPAMLKLNEVRKSYGATVALDSMTLEVRSGEVFGLLGPNGAGKSTTVNLAVGLLDPDRGSVEIEGFGPPRDPRVRRKIGVAPQALAIYEELSAEENLRFFAAIQGIEGRALEERTRWALEFVGLTSRASREPPSQSGSESAAVTPTR